MRRGAPILLVAIALTPAVAAAVQGSAPPAVIQARQAQYREIGTALKTVNDELKKSTPGKFAMASSARQMAGGLRQVRTMFPAGTGPSSGIKMKSLPAIWSNRAEFDRLGASSIVEADKLVVAVRGGDPGAIRAQVKALGAVCQSCHRQFRAED